MAKTLIPNVSPEMIRMLFDYNPVSGSFASEEEAAEAYREACVKYHGEFACHD